MKRLVWWIALIGLSAGLVWALRQAEAPAAALLGPMIGAMIFALCGQSLRPSPLVRLASQTTIGCVIAGVLGASISPAMLGRLGPAMVVSSGTLCLALGLGVLLMRWRWFSGPTAVWGLAPGASAAMIALAEEKGGDPRIAALMQYFRILLVAFAAIGIAHWVGPPSAGHIPAAGHVDLNPTALAITLAFGGLAAWLGQWSRVPAAALLISALAGGTLVGAGVAFQVPPIVVVAAYAVVGWTVGAGFNRANLSGAARALPKIAIAVAILIIACAGAGLLSSRAFGLDPLTAYLASSPGGVDTMLIISTATAVDLPFILACQVIRFILVVALAPWLIGSITRELAASSST